MKRVTMAVAVLVLAGAASAAAQQAPPQDSMRRPMAGMRGQMPMGAMRGQTPEQLRAQIEERWGSMVQTQLGLNDQQMERLRTAERANQDRHRDLNRREEDLQRALRDQLQPGVAANNDSLSRSLDALAAIRVQHAQSDQQLLRDIQFLAPVQRARYMMMARRFRERVDALRGGPTGRMQAQPRPGQGPMQPRRPMPGGTPFDEMN